MDIFLEAFTAFGQAVIDLLPLSPFREFLDSFAGIPYLGYLNWFFPVGACLQIGAAWLTCIGVFYLYSILMRWLKIIGD